MMVSQAARDVDVMVHGDAHRALPAFRHTDAAVSLGGCNMGAPSVSTKCLNVFGKTKPMDCASSAKHAPAKSSDAKIFSPIP